MSDILLDEKITASQKVIIAKTYVSNGEVKIEYGDIINYHYKFASKTKNYINSTKLSLSIIGKKNAIVYEHFSGPLNAKKAQNTFKRIEYVYNKLRKTLIKKFVEFGLEQINSKNKFHVSNVKFTQNGLVFRPRTSFFLKTIEIPYESAKIESEYREWGGGMKFSGKNSLFILKDLSKGISHRYSNNFRYQPDLTEIEKASTLLEYIKENKTFEKTVANTVYKT